MNYRLLLPLFLILSTSGFAQYSKGNRLIGASLGTGNFTSGTTEYTYPASQGFSADSRNFNLSITPSYGVFLNNNTALGFSLLVNSARQKTDNRSVTDTIFSSATNSTTDFGAGVFLRHYLNTDPKRINPFLHAFANGGTGIGSSEGFSYGRAGAEVYRESYTGDASGRVFLNTGLNAGITKVLAPSVGLDLFAGYLFSYSKLRTEITSVRDNATSPDVTQKFEPTQKFTGNGLQLGIGLQVFLGTSRR